MTPDELLRHLEFEYWAEIATQCQDDNFPALIDLAKLEGNPRLRTFEDYLKARGFTEEEEENVQT